jgi:hypothetical protein
MKASFDPFPGPDTTEGPPQVVSGAPGRGWRTWVIAVANALVGAGCRSTSVGGGEGQQTRLLRFISDGEGVRSRSDRAARAERRALHRREQNGSPADRCAGAWLLCAPGDGGGVVAWRHAPGALACRGVTSAASSGTRPS